MQYQLILGAVSMMMRHQSTGSTRARRAHSSGRTWSVYPVSAPMTKRWKLMTPLLPIWISPQVVSPTALVGLGPWRWKVTPVRL